MCLSFCNYSALIHKGLSRPWKGCLSLGWRQSSPMDGFMRPLEWVAQALLLKLHPFKVIIVDVLLRFNTPLFKEK